jgi:hypothetical protein
LTELVEEPREFDGTEAGLGGECGFEMGGGDEFFLPSLGSGAGRQGLGDIGPRGNRVFLREKLARRRIDSPECLCSAGGSPMPVDEDWECSRSHQRFSIRG